MRYFSGLGAAQSIITRLRMGLKGEKPERDENLDYQLNKLLNNGLTLQDNFEGRLLETTLNAGENEIEHNLGFRPIGWIELFKDANESIWAVRETEWTTNKLFLESSAGNLKVRLFVL